MSADTAQAATEISPENYVAILGKLADAVEAFGSSFRTNMWTQFTSAHYGSLLAVLDRLSQAGNGITTTIDARTADASPWRAS
jgi:hypothetical protein